MSFRDWRRIIMGLVVIFAAIAFLNRVPIAMAIQTTLGLAVIILTLVRRYA